MSTTDTPTSFKEIQAVSKRYNERNDCAVKAVAFAAEISYEEAHNLLAKQGRQFGGGTYTWMTMRVMRELGFECKRVSLPGRTVKSLRIPHKGTYLINTSGHILCAKRGTVRDWSAGRQLRPTAIYEVVKTRDASATLDATPPKVGPVRKERKREGYKWEVRLGDEVICRYRRKPRFNTATAYLPGRKAETFGKLQLINIPETHNRIN